MTDHFELGEINTSAAYRLASQVVIPRLRAEIFPTKGSEPFSLRDAIYAILDDEVANGRLTTEQLEATCRVSTNGVNHSLAATTRFYTIHILKSSGEIMSSDVRGLFILTDAEELAEEQDEEEDNNAETTLTGSIYAYTFPSLNGNMVKVGRALGNVEDRINRQLGTANPEPPQILKTWLVDDIVSMEIAIHSILKARKKWVDAPRAKEWFRSNIAEIDAIIQFIRNS